MKERSQNPAPALLVILVLGVAGASAGAEEMPSEPREEVGESSAESHKNVLQWSTATETDNFGYDIYRGDSEDGPFDRLNSDPIEGAGTTDQRSTYEFVDDTIDAHMTYWYYLESISMTGEKARFTSIFRKEPKSGQESPELDSKAKEEQNDPK